MRFQVAFSGAESSFGVRMDEKMEITQDASGYKLPAATAETLGGVKVGRNLTIDSSGVLSVDTADAAQEDDTRPITSAAVYTQIGNINAAPVAGSYELIETITLTEDVTQIIRTEEPDATPYALKAALVGLSTPAGAGTGTVAFAFQANTTYLGFVSMGSAITSSGAISTGEMFLRHGRWNVEAVLPGIGVGTGQLYTYRSPPLLESNYPVINRIKFVALTANIPLPVGTVVNIYGVRA